MIGQEKITINLNAVDLAKVDYLAEQGFYSSRSDFIRTAIRNQLREHEAIVSDEALSNLVQWEKHGERVKSDLAAPPGGGGRPLQPRRAAAASGKGSRTRGKTPLRNEITTP